MAAVILLFKPSRQLIQIWKRLVTLLLQIFYCGRILIVLSSIENANEEEKRWWIVNAIYTWLLLTAALIIIEAMTAGLTTIWFAGGAVAALICTFLGGPVWLQTGIFAAVSLILLLVTRPLALKYMKKGSGSTSLDRMIGQEALVTEQIDNLRGTGEAQVDGQFWMARSADNDRTIDKGEITIIRDIRGVKLIVSPKTPADERASAPLQ